MNAVETVLDPFAKRGDARALLDLVDTVLSSLRSVNIDDSNGFFTEALSQCKGYWNRAFGHLKEPETLKAAKRLLERAEKISGAKRTSEIDWYLVETIEEYVVERFADRKAEAELVLSLADGNIERSRAEFEQRVREANNQRRGWRTNMRVVAPEDYETPRWVVVRLRAMHAMGMDTDELIAYAQPWMAARDVLLKVEQLLEDDGRQDDAVRLLEAALAKDAASSGTAYGARLRLRELYRKSGDERKRRENLEKLVEDGYSSRCDPSSLVILHELKEAVGPDEWPRERSRVLGRVRDDMMKCEYLADEGLVDELIAALEGSRYASFITYEDLLARERPEWLRDRYRKYAEDTIGLAHDRKGYRAAAQTLEHLKEIRGGEEVARELAAEWRERWPRRPALHEELARKGF